MGKLYPGGSLLDLQPEGGAGGFITTGHSGRLVLGPGISAEMGTNLKFGTKS